MRMIYEYDPETEKSGGEIFRIAVVTEEDYGKKDYTAEGYFLISKQKGLIYLSLVNPENSLGITEDTVMTMFELIK